MTVSGRELPRTRIASWGVSVGPGSHRNERGSSTRSVAEGAAPGGDIHEGADYVKAQIRRVVGDCVDSDQLLEGRHRR